MLDEADFSYFHVASVQEKYMDDSEGGPSLSEEFARINEMK